MNISLDVERLHNTIGKINAGSKRQVGDGFTLSYIEMMVHEAELGDDHNYYVYIGHNASAATRARRLFCQAIAKEGMVQDRYEFVPFHMTNTVDVNKKSFLFTSITTMASSSFSTLRGINVDRAFLDVDVGLLNQDEIFRIQTYQALSHLRISLSRRGGDII